MSNQTKNYSGAKTRKSSQTGQTKKKGKAP